MERDTQRRRAQVWGQGVFVFLAILGVLVVTEGKVRGGESGPHPAEVRTIDTHGHLAPSGACTAETSALIALTAMDSYGIQQSLIMPVPEEGLDDCHESSLASVVTAHPDRFAYVGGGATLFPMILAGADATDLEEKVLDILGVGAVALGEFGAEHFSLHSGQPYLSREPDQPLFLLLADIAARYRVPIDFHMEAVACEPVPCTIPLPANLNNGINPPTLNENITAFERLLSHNRGARIVWAHAGWDNTGGRTVALMRRLLHDHPNLYMNIKLRGGDRPNRPLDASGQLDPEWLELIREFPTRFMIGSDVKYPDDSLDPLDSTRSLLDQLPPGLASLVGRRNAIRVYNLDRRLLCHRPGAHGGKTMQVEVRAVTSHLAHGDHLGPCR